MGDFLLVMRYDLTPDLAIAYSSTLIAATVPIWIGSRVSANQKASETMSTKDAYMFPIIASFGLFGLFLSFMWFPREYINMVLTVYFLAFGIGALTSTISPLFDSLLGITDKDKKHLEMNIPFTNSQLFSFDCTTGIIIGFIISVIVSVWYAVTKHWMANNVLGFAFCIQGIALISPGRYHIGCILLGLLLIYDIFWVFGTDVMVTVATSFEGPIKLLFLKNALSGEEWKFSLLGLGDIVLPGIFIAFLYRFDISRKATPVNFYVCLVAYFLGLATTIAVMHLWEHAQPALLYLVPFCLISSFLTALLRGELQELIAYTEESEDKDKEEKKEEKKTE